MRKFLFYQIKQEVKVKDSGELQEFHACYNRAYIWFFYSSSFRNTSLNCNHL